MTTIVSDQNQIDDLNQKFRNRLSELLPETLEMNLGFPGGQFPEPVIAHFSNDHNLWVAFRELDNRFWNGFGRNPNAHGNNNIAVQINFPFDGIDRSIAGVFGIDENGEFLVLHRGGIGGGRNGVGRANFLNLYQGEIIMAQDNNQVNQFIVVTKLDDPGFLANIQFFVNEAGRIRAINQ